MQIYVSGLIELARGTPVGGTWILNREKVMLDMSITDLAFDELRQRIEAQMPGRWECASSDRRTYVYTRTS